MHIDRMDRAALAARETELAARYEAARGEGLALDLTRGKPSIEQLELSAGIDGILGGDYRTADGTDTRGYGGLDGIPEAKALAGAWLGVEPGATLIGGNSSLTLMYLYLLGAVHYGLRGADSAWSRVPGGAKFLCPAPGYDRHFAICEDLGLAMIPVPLTGRGPDMDRVEDLVRGDPSIRGMWCVPRHSNPTGETYSEETVDRVAALGRVAGPEFRVMWDNAYAVHDFGERPDPLASVAEACRRHGTTDSVVLFGSTSKVTFAGAGLSFMSAGTGDLAAFRERLAVLTIGPDKVNQLRHVRFLGDMHGVRRLMEKHAAILRPKFECVERHLREALGGTGMGEWTTPAGGYFVSFDTLPGLAREVVRMAGEAGVALTPAGAAFPHGDDPEDRNIRLAPSFPPTEDVDRAMRVFVTCVALATVRRRLDTSEGRS